VAIGLHPVELACQETIEGDFARIGLDPDMNALLFRPTGKCGLCVLFLYVNSCLDLTDGGSLIAIGYHKRVQIGKSLYYRGIYLHINQ
jgi:hypothetical protein